MPDTAAPETPEAPPPNSRGRVLRILTARPWATAAVAVVVAGAAVGGYALTAGGDGSAAAATVTTRLVSPATGTVRASVSTTGTISSADTEDVSFGSAAKITKVSVAQGDTVSKGQVLGTIDTLALTADLAQAKATLATAKSTLTDAQDNSTTTDAQLEADKTSVASAKSAVTDAEDALDAATLRSPISGTVAEVNVATGDQASGSGSTATSSGAGSTAGGTGGTSGTGGTGTSPTTTSSSTGDFVIVGGAKWTVTASVDDTQVGLIAKGDQVQITTDNVTGAVFGIVSAVSVLSSSTSGAASYPVTIAVTGSPTGLHDGASATAAIVYKQATNVLTVASTAVHTENGTSYVYVSANGTKTKRTVTTGLASGGTTQITTGLTTSDKVYVQTLSRPTGGTSNRTGSNEQQGRFPGGGEGGFPGGGTGGFPGAGTGGGGNR